MNPMNLQEMMEQVRLFHDKNQFDENGGHEPLYRLALMQEELGEISECITKGKSQSELAEEHADLLILLLGNALAFNIDIAQAFQDKMKIIMERKGKMINGRIRVSGAFTQE